MLYQACQAFFKSAQSMLNIYKPCRDLFKLIQQMWNIYNPCQSFHILPQCLLIIYNPCQVFIRHIQLIPNIYKPFSRLGNLPYSALSSLHTHTTYAEHLQPSQGFPKLSPWLPILLAFQSLQTTTAHSESPIHTHTGHPKHLYKPCWAFLKLV